MIIKNANGEVTETPKEKRKEEFKNKKFSSLSRADKDKLLEQMAKDQGYL